MDIGKAILVGLIGVSALLAGCATDNAYQKAFSNESALAGNSKMIAAPQNRAMNLTKLALLRQGFTIEQADSSTGLIKAVRNYRDPDASDVSYNITATVDVTANEPDRGGSIVTLSASQQTVLHRQWHDWWHLLWIIPLFPTGTEYQTVVTNEGNITDSKFYSDFFKDVEDSLSAPEDKGHAASPSTQQQANPSQAATPIHSGSSKGVTVTAVPDSGKVVPATPQPTASGSPDTGEPANLQQHN